MNKVSVRHATHGFGVDINQKWEGYHAAVIARFFHCIPPHISDEQNIS